MIRVRDKIDRGGDFSWLPPLFRAELILSSSVGQSCRLEPRLAASVASRGRGRMDEEFAN